MHKILILAALIIQVGILICIAHAHIVQAHTENADVGGHREGRRRRRRRRRKRRQVDAREDIVGTMRSSNGGENLMEWVKRSGGNVLGHSRIHPRYGGLSLWAQRALPAKAEVLCVPRKAFISPTDSGWWQTMGGVFSDKEILAIRLIEERRRGSASVFADYLRILPTAADLHSLPFYGENELEILKGTYAMSLLHEYRQKLQGFAKRLHELSPNGFKRVISDELKWAVAIVDS